MNHLSIRNQKCPNKFCRFYDKELHGNIVLHGNRYPRFKCKECGKTWVFNRNGEYYGFRKGAEKIKSALASLQKGLGVREVARIEKVSPGTVQRWKKRLKS